MQVGKLDFNDGTHAIKGLNLNLDEKFLLAPRRTRKKIINPRDAARHKRGDGKTVPSVAPRARRLVAAPIVRVRLTFNGRDFVLDAIFK